MLRHLLKSPAACPCERGGRRLGEDLRYGVSELCKGLVQVGNDVVDVLYAYGEADGAGCDVLFGQFLGAHLGVCGGVGMDDEGLHIGYVGQQGEDLEGVDELPGIFLGAIYLEGEDAAAALGEVFLVERMVLVAGKGGMRHAFHLGMTAQIIYYPQRVIHMALDAKGQ